MRKLFFLACVLCAWTAQATTVYTRINNKPSAGLRGMQLASLRKT